MSNQNRNRNRSRSSDTNRRRSVKRRPKKKNLLQRLHRKYEFRPDTPKISLPHLFHLTQKQRTEILKWSLYALVCIFCLIVQDTIMSRFHFFGGTTDLVATVLLLITVVEGIERGSVFILPASLLYFFSGSAPGAFAVAMLTILGIGAAMFRQAYWHRNERSILLCVTIALMGYELGVFGAGLFLELTHFGRLGAFLMTGILSCVLLLPLYPLIARIGRMGGTQWKE